MNHDDTTNTAEDEATGDQQQWIDDLLRSDEAAELEAAPAGVKIATVAAIESLRRRQVRRRSLVALAAAATVAVVWAWPEAPLPRKEGSGEGLATPLASHTPDAPATARNLSPKSSARNTALRSVATGDRARQGRGIFLAGGDSIAVELPSPAPEVTVVQLHPTIIAQRRAETDLILRQLLTAEPNGG